MLLSGNEFTGSLDGPKFQNDFFNVVEVAIGNNNLNGTIPTELGTLGKLESLTMGRNRISGTIPTELALIPLCKILTALRGCEMHLLTQSPVRLHVELTRITGSVPFALCEQSLLTEIRVDCRVDCLCESCDLYQSNNGCRSN
mmetsp:Transcript_1142/g.2924  ORF Transcript_1142/g.2924 Transcript_1142/m.2924 type:complete len:143 (-) Transcript_1142:175-603(-)